MSAKTIRNDHGKMYHEVEKSRNTSEHILLVAETWQQ